MHILGIPYAQSIVANCVVGTCIEKVTGYFVSDNIGKITGSAIGSLAGLAFFSSELQSVYRMTKYGKILFTTSALVSISMEFVVEKGLIHLKKDPRYDFLNAFLNASDKDYAEKMAIKETANLIAGIASKVIAVALGTFFRSSVSHKSVESLEK